MEHQPVLNSLWIWGLELTMIFPLPPPQCWDYECVTIQSTMAPNLHSDLFKEGGPYSTQHLCGDQRVTAVGSLLPPLHGNRD